MLASKLFHRLLYAGSFIMLTAGWVNIKDYSLVEAEKIYEFSTNCSFSEPKGQLIYEGHGYKVYSDKHKVNPGKLSAFRVRSRWNACEYTFFGIETLGLDTLQERRAFFPPDLSTLGAFDDLASFVYNFLLNPKNNATESDAFVLDINSIDPGDPEFGAAINAVFVRGTLLAVAWLATPFGAKEPQQITYIP